ncbi:MAG: DUF6544 family protein [Bacteroidales bacterium]
MFFMIISCTSLKKIVKSEIRNEISDTLRIKLNEVYSEKDFDRLPVQLRSFLKAAGYIGKPKESNLQIIYDKAQIKIDVSSKWKKIVCDHLLFSNPHVRIVYLKAYLLGIIPFEGRDRYKAGHGNMLGMVAKLIKIFDVSDREMNQSALVTYLSEILFLPSACLSDGITWQQINKNSIKATIVDNGLTGTGIFHFNDAGQFIKFTTDDRFEGRISRPWIVKFEDYKNFNGYYLPSKGIATWKYPDYEFEYFIAHLKDFKYNFSAQK